MLLIMWRHKLMEGLVQVVRLPLRAFFCVQEGWTCADMDMTQQFHFQTQRNVHNHEQGNMCWHAHHSTAYNSSTQGINLNAMSGGMEYTQQHSE